MRNDIIIYCKDKNDLLETAEYIKDNFSFNHYRINALMPKFINYKNGVISNKAEDIDTQISMVTLRENIRGMRGNIGLYTKNAKQYMDNSKHINFEGIIRCSINDFKQSIESREFGRWLASPINTLEKILRDDIIYLLIRDYRDCYDIKYITNDIVAALSYLRKNKECRIHICKSDNIDCEINSYNIDGEWNYQDVVQYISELTI